MAWLPAVVDYRAHLDDCELESQRYQIDGVARLGGVDSNWLGDVGFARRQSVVVAVHHGLGVVRRYYGVLRGTQIWKK